MEEKNTGPRKTNYNIPVIIFLITFSFFAILGAVYSVYQYRELEKEVAELRNNLQTTPTTRPSPSAEEIPIDDWQSYTNENYSFSFRYPDQWTVRQPAAEQGDLIEYIDSDQTTTQNGQEMAYYLWLESAQSLPEYDYTKTLVNHYPAFRTSQKPSRNGTLTYFIKKTDDQYISVSLTPYNSDIPYSNQKDLAQIFEKILTTFQFLDQEAAIIVQGALQSIQRPGPDVPYDYQIELTTPYYDELNAMQPGYVNSFVVVPDNETINQKLENLVGETASIQGKIEWGLAETRHLRATTVVSN